MDWIECLMSKILIVTRGNLPSRAANSVQIYKTAKYMAELGHDVHLAIDHNCSELVIKRFYGDSRVTILNALPIRNTNNLRRITNLIYRRKILDYARELKIDIIFTRDLLLLPKINVELRVIWETHSWDFSTKIKKRIGRIPNLSVVTISNELAKRISDHYKIDARVLHDACDGMNFADTNLIEKKVVFTGHLYKHRGIDQILRVASSLPDMIFEIYGGMENDISYWEKQNKNENVIFKGFVNPNKIGRVQATSGILLINYSKKLNTAKYCSPLKLSEYISTGNIVVSSTFGPIVKEYGEYIHTFEADNDLALIEILRKIYNNYEKLLQQQKKKVITHPPLDWYERCDQILQVGYTK